MGYVQRKAWPGVLLDANSGCNRNRLRFFNLDKHGSQFTGVSIQRHDVDMPEQPCGVKQSLSFEDVFRIEGIIFFQAAGSSDELIGRPRIAGYQDLSDDILSAFGYPVSQQSSTGFRIGIGCGVYPNVGITLLGE